jgi:Predicted membrane protein
MTVLGDGVALGGGKTVTGWLLIGFALGGFFDGILLHQILQWHHLLSGLSSSVASDLPFQLLADGLFHLLMYVIAVLGGMVLLRYRSPEETSGSVLRPVLFGFGAWHLLDAFISHWVLGIHRIRMDSELPVVWDLAWLVIFGIAPIVIGLMLPHGGRPSRGFGRVTLGGTVMAALATSAGPLLQDGTDTIVVFHPGKDQPGMMKAVMAAGANVKQTDATGTIWVVDDVSWRGLVTLHLSGALLVSSTPVLAGCLGWTRA